MSEKFVDIAEHENVRFIRLTEKDTENQTKWNKMKAEKMKLKLKKYEEDPSIKERKEANKCRTCYYINTDQVCFQAFTDTNCGICGKKMTFPNSNVDKVCPECAKEKALCTKCGAYMD